MDIASRVTRSIDAHAPFEHVYALLADVPRSVLHFPDTESVRPLGEAWEWRLRKLGAGPLSLQVHYAARYHVDAAERLVRWDAVPGVGNAQVEGRWHLDARGAHTRLTMDSRFVLTTPFPRPTRAAVEAIARREIERLVDGYLANLRTTLEGGDGRASGRSAG